MKYIVSAEEAQRLDELSTSHFHIPSIVLMERAAISTANVIRERVDMDKRIVAVCGNGNNAGDCIATARILHEIGYQLYIYIIEDVSRLSELALLQFKIAEECGVPILKSFDPHEYDVIIDGIFGIGLNKSISGQFANVIKQMNESEKYIFSIDIPSGIHSTTGKEMGAAVHANVTITYGAMKMGLLICPGNGYAGEVIVQESIFPSGAITMTEAKQFYYEENDLSLLPKRTMRSNKGTYGNVLIIAGSPGMAGAAYLSAKAAYRSGCGLVKVLTCERNRTLLQSQLPEAIVSTYDPDFVKEDSEGIIEHIKWADAIVIGPGLGVSESTKQLIALVLRHSEVPFVVDADAINAMADEQEPFLKSKNEVYSLKKWRKRAIFTPHLKEMSRLCKYSVSDIQEDVVGFAKENAKSGIIYVLKDARTVVSDGEQCYINCSGNNGMATAGSGDVLTGIIASLAAQGATRMDAATLGVYLHGLAGDYASVSTNKYSVMAHDIIDALKEVRGL